MPLNLTIAGFSVWFFVKLLFLTGITVYLIFAGVVIKQVRLMAETIEIPLAASLRLVSWAHFLFALAVFVIALLFL